MSLRIERMYSYHHYGCVGAGKSTFIARLKANGATSTFSKLIKSNSQSIVNVAGVNIGSSALSTTLIPQFHIFNKLAICDNPGFWDTNPDNMIIINILQKCLLSRVDSPEFLIMVSVKDILDPKFT